MRWGGRKKRSSERTNGRRRLELPNSQPASQPASESDSRTPFLLLSLVSGGAKRKRPPEKKTNHNRPCRQFESLSLSLPLEKSEVNELHSADVLYPSSDQCSGECHKCTICQLWRIIKCSPLHSLRDFVISFTSVHP